MSPWVIEPGLHKPTSLAWKLYFSHLDLATLLMQNQPHLFSVVLTKIFHYYRWKRYRPILKPYGTTLYNHPISCDVGNRGPWQGFRVKQCTVLKNSQPLLGKSRHLKKFLTEYRDNQSSSEDCGVWGHLQQLRVQDPHTAYYCLIVVVTRAVNAIVCLIKWLTFWPIFTM